jgi:Transposase DDE domain
VTRFKRRRGKPLRFVRVPLRDDHPDWLDLDRRLPPDPLARRIRALVDSLDLAPLLESYSGVGGPIIPPALMLAFVLFENQRKRLSPAEWFLDSQESEPARWLLRGLRPCRASCYRFAVHLAAADLVDDLNRQVLLLAVGEGHTTAEHGALDGTFTAAYGSRHRLGNDDTLTARLQLLDQVIAQEVPVGQTSPPDGVPAPSQGPSSNTVKQALAEPAPAPAAPPRPAEPATPEGRPYWMARTAAGRRRQQARYQVAQKTLRRRMAEHERKQKGKARNRRTSAANLVICPTEPEAVAGKDKLKVFRPLYNVQIMQDSDSRFILGYAVYSQASDSGLLQPMLRRTEELSGRKVKKVLTDGIYATLADVRYCKENEVVLYAPVQEGGSATSGRGRRKKKQGSKGQLKEKQIGRQAFSWEEGLQTYRCPEGHLLEQLGIKQRERANGEQVQMREYRCASEHCLKCPRAARCTSNPQRGRTVSRMVGQELLDEVAARMKTQEGEKEYKKRGQTVEPRHGDMRTHRGLQRFHGYGTDRADSQIGLLTLAHNGLSLLAAREQSKASRQATSGPPPSRPHPPPHLNDNNDWLCWN